ncbi:hypothetical protein [Ruegeria sp. EL01]|uniref:hypothetical protein n=1 Tax=Ruegeria sp. EL01 TaxID=2107578 RepID=UPI000EA82293|nr:hypothetical protein [Ruegeria sp. EL01]
MNNSTILFLVNDDIRAIACEYEENGPITVFKTFDQTIKVDDLVAVQTDTRHGMTVVKVKNVDIDIDFDNSPKIKWAVQRIDAAAFDGVLAKEGEIIAAVQTAEKKRKRAELRKSLLADHEDEINTLALVNHKDEGVTE